MNNANTIKVPAISTDIKDAIITLTFANGAVITLDAQQLDADVIDQATMHGLKQKLSDGAAISRNTDTGQSASIDDKYEAVLAVRDQLMAGSWNRPRAGGGGMGKTSGGLLLAALEHLYEGKKSREELRAYLAARSEGEKAALRKVPKVASIIDSLRKTPEGVDIEGLLAGLE